jgi:predicted transcriptional regulator
MTNTINIKFGQKVKKVRQKLGMTQEELAEQARTSYKYIQRIEGKTPPDIRLSTIQKIAKALNTDAGKLVSL